MNCRLLKILGLLALCLAWGLEPAPAPASPAGSGPRMVLENRVFDFGKVLEGQPMTHTFLVRNQGNAPLEITEVDPACACTVPRYDREIPAGGQGEITLTIQPFSVSHQFKKKTVVRTNDPGQPQTVLELKGEVQPLIEIRPSHVISFRGDVHEEKRTQVQLVSHLQTPWQIKEYRTNIPDKIELDLKVEEPGRLYVLEVRNRCAQAGRYTGLIELFTTSKEKPRLVVRVFADLHP